MDRKRFSQRPWRRRFSQLHRRLNTREAMLWLLPLVNLLPAALSETAGDQFLNFDPANFLSGDFSIVWAGAIVHALLKALDAGSGKRALTVFSDVRNGERLGCLSAGLVVIIAIIVIIAALILHLMMRRDRAQGFERPDISTDAQRAWQATAQSRTLTNFTRDAFERVEQPAPVTEER